MLSQITSFIDRLDTYPDFGVFYQDYVKEAQDMVLANEFKIKEKEMVQVKSFDSIITQLNDLTEELKTL